MKFAVLNVMLLCLLMGLAGCGAGKSPDQMGYEKPGGEGADVYQESAGDFMEENRTVREAYTVDTKISEVIGEPVFGDYGRLIFPVESGYCSGDTLGTLGLTWYSNIDPEKTVEIANYMMDHALELSKKGYNASALIYRPGAQTACEDLARAVSFIFEHAEELETDTDCYSLWGGSAGARMAAWVGSYGTAAFGGDNLPQPGTVIMQYTGHSDYTKNDPPTYACVGENDGIASWRTMENRLHNLEEAGIPTEFHKYPGLGHGFGLGTGTAAEGWIDDAVTFWENQAYPAGIP